MRRPLASSGPRSLVASLTIALVAACGGKVAPPEPATAAPGPVASAPAPAPAPAAAAANAPPVPPLPGVEVATGTQGAVASAERHASAVGRAILERGGNAVDAAVALGFALGVTHPVAANIGGGGFMTIRTPDGKATILDFREVAPGKATADMYLDAKGNVTLDRLRGPRAAGIPGNVAGFAMAHKKLGTLPWRQLIEPAIGLARDGHVIDKFHADDIADHLKETRAYLEEVEAAGGDPALVAGLRETIALSSRPDGTPLVAGDRMVATALATTLAAIARDPSAFYRGPLARKLATEVTAMGGLWTTADLAGYRPIERKPIVFDYRGHQIITPPPPSAGGITLRQIFGASEVLKLHELPWGSADRTHLYAEALRRIYADRAQLIADPAFVKVPIKTLLDPGYLARRLADIDRERATPSSQVAAGITLEENRETTHFSVVDRAGMAVSVTYTLNGSFGAHLVIPGTGVELNNEMDDFTAKVGAPNLYGLVQGPANAIAPGKRMVSSMSPTIVAKDGKLRLVCGTPGGSTIPTTVAGVLFQVIDYGRPLDQAVAGTRVHHQWQPDTLFHEATLDPAVVAALAGRGHTVKTRVNYGHTNCIEVDPATGGLRAVADTGRDGGAADAY